MGASAKVLPAGGVRRLLGHVARGRYGLRNRIIVLLSFKAGLRAGEIAKLEWRMVLTPAGKVGGSITVERQIAKMGSGRRVPLHQDLKSALEKLHRSQGWPTDGPIIRSERGGAMTARSVVNWFAEHYRSLGLEGCSSHSGRRTFITSTARLIAKVGGSLRDVQELAGHRSITTTERYIEGDRDIQRKLVRLI